MVGNIKVLEGFALSPTTRKDHVGLTALRLYPGLEIGLMRDLWTRHIITTYPEPILPSTLINNQKATMKVLILGATGNLGSRLVPALLTHGHRVVAFVRSPNKLESLLPASVYQQITVVQGDATNPSSIKKAILETSCDAIVSTAGVAALAPWRKSELPRIFQAVLEAVQEAGLERGKALRTWFLGGMGVLYYPGTQSMMSNYVPIYLEHRQNFHLLKSLPPNAVDWSMLCPMTLVPESSDLNVPTTTSQGRLVPKAATPPLWQDSWMRFIPLIGKTLTIAMNAKRYETTLEENAEFIASDLESLESRWSGTTVGVINASK